MTARALDLEVLRNGRPLDSFQAHGDPEDIAWLQKRLKGYLQAKKWDKALWAQFEVIAREAGMNRQLAKARAVLCRAGDQGRCGMPRSRSAAPASSPPHGRTRTG